MSTEHVGRSTEREYGDKGETEDGAGRRKDVVSGGEGERLEAVTLIGGHCVEACW